MRAIYENTYGTEFSYAGPNNLAKQAVAINELPPCVFVYSNP